MASLEGSQQNILAMAMAFTIFTCPNIELILEVVTTLEKLVFKVVSYNFNFCITLYQAKLSLQGRSLHVGMILLNYQSCGLYTILVLLNQHY